MPWESFDQAKSDLRWLKREDGVVPEEDALRRLENVLRPLLRTDGFQLSIYTGGDSGFDLLAMRASRPAMPKVGIEYKHHAAHPLGVNEVRQVIGMASTLPFERALLIGRFGFTPEARRIANDFAPVAVQLFDLEALSAWIARSEEGASPKSGRVQFLIRAISHAFAQAVAARPEELDEMEWRDLERMMARVMEGLGFDVTLTPASKDGGKDLILSCTVQNNDESYIVELKHWRAGKTVGRQVVSHFLEVVIDESRTGGLFLSTSGYSADAHTGITEVMRQRVRLGNEIKVIHLAQMYMKACFGLWSPPTELPGVLFEDTV
jgi:restriction system protein